MSRQFTLGKKERLKSRKTIDLLFKEGQRFAVSPFRVFYHPGAAEAISTIQCGVGVSSRNFKKAVDRNRIKRLLREAYRLQKNDWQQQLSDQGKKYAVFILYTGTVLPEFTLVAEKMEVILGKLMKLTNETNNTNT